MIKIINNPFDLESKLVEFSSTKRTENVQVNLVDAATDLKIHGMDVTLDPDFVFWLKPSPYELPWVKDFYLEVRDPKSKERKDMWVFFSTPGFKKGIAIRDKIITFPYMGEPNFGVYCEIFKDQLYYSDKVKPNVGEVVVDIGANVGIASLWFQQFSPSRIIAVEPEKNAMENCKSILQEFDNVEYIQKAISRETGVVEFEVSYNSALNSIKGYSPSRGVEKITQVESISINDLIKEYDLETIDYLKVDCEGGEVDLFDTIDPEYLQGRVKKIVVEYHSPEIREFLKEKMEGFILEKDRELTHGDGGVGLLYYYNPKFIN